MRVISVTVGPLAAPNAALFVASVTPTSGTLLTLAATKPDTPRRVLLTFGNEASSRTLVLTGTNVSGNTITETLAVPSGAGATVASVLDYATLTSALPLGGGWTAAATLGTNGVASSAWIRSDDWAAAPAGLQINVTGTVNYTVEQSFDDPNLVLPQIAVTPAKMQWIAHSVLNGLTTDQISSNQTVPPWTRLTINSSTAGAGNFGVLTFNQYYGAGAW